MYNPWYETIKYFINSYKLLTRLSETPPIHTNSPTNAEYLYSDILRNFTITENESDSVNQLNESFFLNNFSSSFR